jgi:hypothetical protein
MLYLCVLIFLIFFFSCVGGAALEMNSPSASFREFLDFLQSPAEGSTPRRSPRNMNKTSLAQTLQSKK